MKRVILIEDQVSVREMLATVLRLDGGYEIVAECSDGHTAYAACLELKPDLVILDVLLPGLNGVSVLKRFTRQLKDTRVLVLSGFSNPALVRELLLAGAHGFVGKSANLAELRKGIQTVAEGGNFFSPFITEMLREVIMNPHQIRRHDLDALTKREREILQLIAESHSTREIAKKLEVSIKTAENHRTNLMKKLKLHDVASLTRFAIEHGMTTCNVTPAA
jgi:DNA-binding NarL/FixJ family response regulator